MWRAKFRKLAPALAARWHEDGRKVVTVEERLAKSLGEVTLTAKLDRVERGDGGRVIIDYKTGTPPAWSKVAAGIKPQLALEAWLASGDVEDVEYWRLKGYGDFPLDVLRPGGRTGGLEKLVAPVADGVDRLAHVFRRGEVFSAVPDMAGGGLMATGHCAQCKLAGVCRRKVARHA